MSTREEVKEAIRRIGEAQAELRNYLDEPHQHNDPVRNTLLDNLKNTNAEFWRLFGELKD